jgi:hypothetical protein
MDPNEVSEGLTAAVETAGGLIIEYGMSVIGAIVLFIVGRIIAGWSRSRLTKVLTKASSSSRYSTSLGLRLRR